MKASALCTCGAHLISNKHQLSICVNRDVCCAQVWDVQLANPTRRLLSYTARLEGPGDFSLEASVVKVEPGRATQVSSLFDQHTCLSCCCCV
jgi:hypothetical protein